ncbi:MAG: hypothetical protein L0338_08435 [Acidobacteria bacterium]|nr:hypothetical protein [Acidobacteriota bacterium]
MTIIKGDDMSSKTTRTTQNALLALASLTLAALTATGIGAQTAGPNGADREPNFRSLRQRGDIKFLPAPLQDRLVELARRPHSYLPLTAFSEADEPSRLFGYYLLDTTTIPPNVFTSIVPGINDNGVIPTGANFANGGLPTLGAVRMTLEPKPGLPTDPNDPRAFIDMFTDISGLFVINNESGWYEGWMTWDLRVPRVAEPLAGGRAQYGTMTPADAAALAARGTGNNVPGHFFTLDGNAVRFPSAGGAIPGNTVGFSVSIGAFNAQQQSDVHAYWEFNRGTNWVFPLYELPFTGGLPGTFPALQYGLQSVIPGSGPFGVRNTAATHGDDPNNPRDPDRFEPVSSGQTETRNRFVPSGLAAEIFRNVFTRPASFLPGVTDVAERLLRAYAIEVARVDQNGDGALSFAEADVAGSSDGLPNTRLYLSPASFNRFFVSREINDGLLAPRLEPSQRAWVLSGFLTLVQPAVRASVPEDADLR